MLVTSTQNESFKMLSFTKLKFIKIFDFFFDKNFNFHLSWLIFFEIWDFEILKSEILRFWNLRFWYFEIWDFEILKSEILRFWNLRLWGAFLKKPFYKKRTLGKMSVIISLKKVRFFINIGGNVLYSYILNMKILHHFFLLLFLQIIIKNAPFLMVY